MMEADAAFPVPPVNDDSYCEALLSLCARQQVDLLIPLNDLELPLLAMMQTQLQEAGTAVMISSPEVIDTCWDKWKAFQFFTAQNLPTARTYCTLEESQAALARGELHFPVVIKPRWGSASFYIEVCKDHEQLALAHAFVSHRAKERLTPQQLAQQPCCYVLVQEFLPGQEFAVDIVNDLSARFVCALAKRKLAMRAGETDRAVTARAAELTAVSERIGKALGHIGLLDCDLMMVNGTPHILDLNPRFGGGYPFSHVAGADIPMALLAWVQGATPDPNWFTVEPGVLAAKCDQLYVRRTSKAMVTGEC
jgi:carbamoyl-phosphate synthase large subunit